jgi:hypothetical protein
MDLTAAPCCRKTEAQLFFRLRKRMAKAAVHPPPSCSRVMKRGAFAANVAKLQGRAR